MCDHVAESAFVLHSAKRVCVCVCVCEHVPVCVLFYMVQHLFFGE